MSLESRIIAAGSVTKVLAIRLKQWGFQFENPEAVFPGPEPGTDEVIASIEGEVGSVPLAMKVFWREIGSVDFCGSHPDWDGCEYPDPLVIYPPSVALNELDEFLDDKAERLRCNFPYVIPVAPDYYHKADTSGGMFYNVSVPAVADDPPLNDEWHETTLVSYLEISLKWAGFPGLYRYPHHGWPIREVLQSLAWKD